MELRQLGKNVAILETNHGDEVLFSYNTPVAGFNAELGYFVTTHKYGGPTTRHINKYLMKNAKVTKLSFSEIEDMFLNRALV